jgi:hypothetical protein
MTSSMAALTAALTLNDIAGLAFATKSATLVVCTAAASLFQPSSGSRPGPERSQFDSPGPPLYRCGAENQKLPNDSRISPDAFAFAGDVPLALS